MRKTLLLGAALAAATLTPSVARAVPIPISGTGSTGSSFTGTFEYSAASDTSGTVTVTLNDTTPASVGGFLTAFVFNIPDSADVTGATLTSTLGTFSSLLGPTTFSDNVNGAPFGLFDIGATTDPNAPFTFEGGGAPNRGIPVGGSATFTFTLTGSGLSGLTSASFLSTLSNADTHGGEGAEDFVARFRGLTDGGSVPEPGTLMLIGAGVASLVARRRLRQ
jgi:hypothetical protein